MGKPEKKEDVKLDNRKSLDLNPLVSIIVITYNSSKYVLETLESAKAQTYQNIELIVSDDGSTDNTIEICKIWIEKNKDRFVKTEIITVEKNTGIPANCNRGLYASRGIWIKLIAGDDMLMTDCIDTNLLFILYNQNKNIKILHSSMEYYSNYFTADKFIKIRSLANNIITYTKITSQSQYKLLLRSCLVNAPSVFAEKELYTNLGGFDERLAIEDWPMWLKICSNGIKIHYLDKPTIKYRVRSDSVCNEKIADKIFNNHFIRERAVYEKYIFPNIPFFEKTFLQIHFLRLEFLSKHFSNKNYLNRLISKVSAIPYWLYYNHYLRIIHLIIKRKIKGDEIY